MKKEKLSPQDKRIKLRPSLFDRIFRKDRFKKIIELRTQIKFMQIKFEEIDIWKRIGEYKDISNSMFGKSGLTLNEVSMYHDKGEQAVIDRLTKDRNEIFELLKPVEELDLSSVAITMREEKFETIFDEV